MLKRAKDADVTGIILMAMFGMMWLRMVLWFVGIDL